MSAVHELAITRHIAAPRAAVWQAWSEHIADWWAPRPWTCEVVAHDLWPGGRSALLMRGPGGEVSDLEGVFLEVVPAERVVFTNAFTVGWIPQAPFMLGFVELSDDGEGTRYHAGARHWSEEAMRQHQLMGFEAGWAIVAGQLEEVARRLVG